MGDDAGAGQLPVVEELGEVPRVSRQAEVLALALVRLPEAEMVDDEDRAGTGEGLERSLRVPAARGLLRSRLLSGRLLRCGRRLCLSGVGQRRPACVHSPAPLQHGLVANTRRGANEAADFMPRFRPTSPRGREVSWAGMRSGDGQTPRLPRTPRR